MALDNYKYGAIGLVKSVMLNSYTQIRVREPTLVIHTEEELSAIAHLNTQHEITVPLIDMETPSHCEQWIENALKSMGLLRVGVASAADHMSNKTANARLLLRKLIWKMKQVKPLGAGEVYTGVVEMSVTRMTMQHAEEFHRRNVEAGINNMRVEFKSGGAAEGSYCTTCCAICLDVLVEKSLVVELRPCSHVFHRECIEAWMIRKASCPYCRSQVKLDQGFWMDDTEHSALPLDLSA